MCDEPGECDFDRGIQASSLKKFSKTSRVPMVDMLWMITPSGQVFAAHQATELKIGLIGHTEHDLLLRDTHEFLESVFGMFKVLQHLAANDGIETVVGMRDFVEGAGRKVVGGETFPGKHDAFRVEVEAGDLWR